MVQECFMKDDSRPITVALKAEAVNRLPHWRRLCRESRTINMVQECCMKDDSRPITVAMQAEAVNRISVLV